MSQIRTLVHTIVWISTNHVHQLFTCDLCKERSIFIGDPLF